MSAKGWLRQPTTITGIASALAAIAAAGAHAAALDSTTVSLIGAAVFSLVHMLVDDNTVAHDAETLAIDLLRAQSAPPTPPTAG